jgi:SPP1 gp7 family putative phage head morphogenesis protein
MRAELEGVAEFLDVSADGAFDVPSQEAIDYFRRKGLTPTFSYAEMLGKAHDQAFTVAKMMDMDLLKQVRDSLDMALANGTPFGEWKKTIAPMMKQAGWWGVVPMLDPQTGRLVNAQTGSAWRLETIFRTNLQNAYSAGQWAQMEQQADAAPYLLYDAIDDHRTRPAHRAWDGVVLPMSDPWWRTHTPPCGWNCRCGVIQLSPEQLGRMGISPRQQAPNDGIYKWTNPRTGDILSVPNGVDPGFDYNPGVDLAAHLRKVAIEKAQALPQEMLTAAAVAMQRALPGADVSPELVASTARLETAQTAYERVFKMPAPDPLGIDPLEVAAVLEQAIVDGVALPDGYDWWRNGWA